MPPKQQDLATAINALPINPIIALALSGVIGGGLVVCWDFYLQKYSRRSLIHFLFGLGGAIIAGLINTVPGLAGIMLTGFVAGLGGVTILAQYFERKEGDKSISTANEEILKTLQYNQRIDKLIDDITHVIDEHQEPRTTVRGIARLLREYQDGLD